MSRLLYFNSGIVYDQHWSVLKDCWELQDTTVSHVIGFHCYAFPLCVPPAPRPNLHQLRRHARNRRERSSTYARGIDEAQAQDAVAVEGMDGNRLKE